MSTYETVTLAFTSMVALSTVVYALLTWKLVAETRLLREAQTQPHIGVYLRPSDAWLNFFDLVIENHGHGAAYDIRWDAGPDLNAMAEKGVHLDYLKSLDGLTYMAPGQRIQSFFGSAVDLLKHDPPPCVTVSVQYADAQQAKHKSSYVLDPARFKGQSRVGGNPEHEMAKALTELSKLFNQVVERSRVKILTMSQQELDEQDKRRREAEAERAFAAQPIGVGPDGRPPAAPARRSTP